MIIHYLDFQSIILFPDKTEPPAVIDSDAVLALPISLECL
jgi:hypothetical protein